MQPTDLLALACHLLQLRFHLHTHLSSVKTVIVGHHCRVLDTPPPSGIEVSLTQGLHQHESNTKAELPCPQVGKGLVIALQEKK